MEQDGKSKGLLLTLALHGHRNVNVYFQFTVNDKKKEHFLPEVVKNMHV